MRRLAHRTWLVPGLAVAVVLGAALFVGLRQLYASLTPPTMDLASVTPELTVLGGSGINPQQGGLPQGDAVGRHLAAGDFDGDGKQDLLLGAPRADGGVGNPRGDAGEAYVIFGSSGAPVTKDLGANQQDLTILGAASLDRLGSSVGAGDVNGDGFDDIIVGANGATGAQPQAGAVYVIYGAPRATLTQVSVRDMANASHRNVAILGTDLGDRLGSELAAGDVNNDGKDDILVTAAQADGLNDARQQAGEVYGVFGSASLPATVTLVEPQTPGGSVGQLGFTIIGAAAGDTLGSSVDVGDVTGDGKVDILVGADDASTNSGRAYLVLGAPATKAVIDLNVSGQAALTIIGANGTVDGGDSLGSRVAVGEVNGDGRADLLLTAPDAYGPAEGRPCAGEGYVIFGSPAFATPPSETVNIASGQQDVTLYSADGGDPQCETGGAEPGDEMSNVAVGNVDGDGTGDIVFSADNADGPTNNRADAGEAYVRYSSDGLPTGGMVIDVRTPGGVVGSVQPTLTLFGAAAADDAGSGILVADVNGDFGGDLAVGAPGALPPPCPGCPAGYNPGGKGKVFVFFGSAGPPPPPTPTLTPTPTPTPTQPDKDGDGIPDKFETNTGVFVSSTDTGTNPNDADTDKDGCGDGQELGQNPSAGGRRNPTVIWDLFDTRTVNGANGGLGAGSALTGVSSVEDVLDVASRFGRDGSPAIDPLSDASGTGYHTRFDRGGPVSGGDPWDLNPANGTISLGDVLDAAVQFGTSC